MTLDVSSLARTIDDRHLAPESIARYAAEFHAHPARLVVIRDFLDEDLAHRLNRFLVDEAEYYTEYGLYSADDPVDDATWHAADDPDRFFRMSKLARTKPEHRMSPNALSYLKFRSMMNSPQFIAFFEMVCGEPLRSADDVGVHSMREGDFLRRHSDANKERRIAFVIYLSEKWSQDFGGTLEVLDRTGSVTKIEPQFNSIVAFDVLAESLHLITPVTSAAAGQARATIGGWYSQAA